jgi:plastocyanin
MARIRLVVAAAAAATGLLGWSLAVAGAAPRVHVISIAKLAFGPEPPDVHVNDVVEWANDDILQHSATAVDGSFDVELRPAGRGRATLNHAGVITYMCRYHPGMKAQLTVTP